ncbi:hypothetical protein TFLX_03025 [Thermoflexales bacterium]|nr:hypothetical protein TFLX_03025 [Thermoflexales bacterium]
MVRGFFPLDEELGLVPGRFTPRLQESLTRLGTWMPFRHAAEEREFFTGVAVSEATARRVTERAGRAYVDVQTAQVADLERTLPLPSRGPERLLLSADGAFVPLVSGEWTEVKTLAVGVIAEPVWDAKHAERVVHTGELSYFSRRAEAADFTHLALVETHRRGVETAGRVAAVTDGADWLQGFMNYHRNDATRILDFPHASEHLAVAGRVVHGEATPAFAAWFEPLCHRLKHADPEQTLDELRHLIKRAEVEALGSEAVTTLQAQLEYLEKRRAMITYAAFQQQGLPIGDGCVESANKLVVETRLKQAGMRWAPEHVNPLVALRNIACNDRWTEAWAQINDQQRTQARQRTSAQRAPTASSQAETSPVTREVLLTAPELESAVSEPPRHKETPAPKAKTPYRSAPDHPWRHSPIDRARSCQLLAQKSDAHSGYNAKVLGRYT